MTELLTPGLHRQPLDPVRAAGALARGDVAVLLGYARRGPVGTPVRVRSVRQLEDVFGAPPAHGHLWHAVKGFMETGGTDAYVVRVASPAARAASADLGDGPLAWRATASFPWTMVDPRRLRGDRGAEAWRQVVERQLLEHGPRSPEPGTWGDGLAVEVRRTARARTVTEPDPLAGATASRVASLAGLSATTVVELAQPGDDGGTRTATAVPAAVDTARGLVHWRTPLADLGFDPDRAVRLTSVEHDVTVFQDGRREQSFAALAPHPDAPHALARVLDAACRALDLVPLVRQCVAGRWVDAPAPVAAAVLAATDWADPATWPPEGLHPLTGGADGLEDVDAAVWLAGCEQAARLPDAALLACPDLVLGAAAPPPSAPVPEPPRDCADLTPPAGGHLHGVVTGAGTDLPVPGVRVDVTGPGGVTTTAADGAFTLDGLPDGVLTLQLTHPRHEPLEALAQASPFASAPPVQLVLVPLSTPRALPSDEVLTVQRALVDPALVGPYKVAVLDPPTPDARLDDLTTWRARLGDEPRMLLAAPWLLVSPAGQGRGTGTGELVACPPSGHVCGAFAAAEHAVGVHRTGANLPLRSVEGTTLAVGNDEQAVLNPAGVSAVRVLPGRGVRLFGSRSLSTDPVWRFITARRVVDAVEKTLEQALQWAVFEPASDVTRHAAATTAASLLAGLHRDGVLAGDTPEAAYAVKCDRENNPPEVRDAGRLVLDVALAPTDPYEFVIVRIGTALDALGVTET